MDIGRAQHSGSRKILIPAKFGPIANVVATHERAAVATMDRM
jgi:hypothetical protein